MTKLITKKQLNEKKKELNRLRKKHARLAKRISEVMKNSGSFPSNTPGYVGLMDRINGLALKITQLEKEISSAKIVNPKEIPSDTVSVLSCVMVLDILENKKEKYCFGKNISQDSLIGKALLGKKVGEQVKIKTPKGERELEILEIETLE